jgi:hypothetical protein
MLDEIINLDKVATASIETAPFSHMIIDDFFVDDVAKALEGEFPDYDSDVWLGYNNAIEVKKINSHWHKFNPLTYQVLTLLNQQEVINLWNEKFNLSLFSDPGLHGGGWHIHKRGGKLNPHLDYNIHPKLNLQRRLNLIVYLNSHWQESWGGHLGLWQGESKPETLVKSVVPKFNRAVIFETVGSWHGLPEPIEAPEGQCRQSLAVYYLTEPQEGAEVRYKALFAPHGKQIGNHEVEALIEARVDMGRAKGVYE